MEKIFNLVFDTWVGDEPRPNAENLFERKEIFGNPSNLIKHYVDDTNSTDKFSWKLCNMNEVQENPNENFYYVINHRLNIEILFRDGQSPFTEAALEYVKKYPNFFIMFITEHECDTEDGFKSLYDFVKINQLDESKFFVINNNAKLDEYKIKYDSLINIHSIQFVPHSSTKVLVKVGGFDFIPNKEGKFSMLFNKSPRQHRAGLLCYLKTANLLDEINWSYVPSYDCYLSKYFLEDIFDKFDVEEHGESMEYFDKLGIKVSDYEVDMDLFTKYNEPNTNGFPPWMTVPEYSKNYMNSYLNIVTESQFMSNNNVIHISEKSIRPFYYYQYPMILATHGHIRKMKERYGFDFFEDVIDHSYDLEPNDKKRFIMFFNEIKRLHSNKGQLIDFYKNNQDRFEKNKQRAISVLEVVEQDFEYFKSLI